MELRDEWRPRESRGKAEKWKRLPEALIIQAD